MVKKAAAAGCFFMSFRLSQSAIEYFTRYDNI